MVELDTLRLGTAIDALYEAALEPDLWAGALDALSKALGGIGAASFHLPGSHRGWWESSPDLRDCVDEFIRDDWQSLNVRTERGLPRTRAGCAFITEAMLFQPGELDRQLIQAEFFEPHGLRSFVGFEFVPGRILASIERGHHAMEPWEIQALHAGLAPHLNRIGTMAMVRAESRADGVLDGLSQLNCPALLLDDRGAVLRANAAAKLIVDDAFTLRAGILTPRHRASGTAFAALVAQAVMRGRPQDRPPLVPVVVDRPARRPLVVHAMPLVGEGRRFFEIAQAVLVFSDPDLGVEMGDVELRRMFGLTPGEIRVARLVFEGQDVGEAASTLAVGRETVRSHLSSVFAKTGTRRQGELTGLLHRVFRTRPSI